MRKHFPFVNRNFNPRSPWGERHRHPHVRAGSRHFNPRSPWGERLWQGLGILRSSPISIHAPRGGSDAAFRTSGWNRLYFNPRSPWGERLHSGGLNHEYQHFNPRSPWGERLQGFRQNKVIDEFQSTLPVGGATVFLSANAWSIGISIHAPRGGSDMAMLGNVKTQLNFNPRSPWGERLKSFVFFGVFGCISIHAPRGGSDAGRWL